MKFNSMFVFRRRYKLYKSSGGFSKYSPVVSIHTAVEHGWCLFFDDCRNRCIFMHLETGHCEAFIQNIGTGKSGPVPSLLVPYQEVRYQLAHSLSLYESACLENNGYF
jgi:hypothetical protein